jgi:hypothetical protein
MILVLTTPRTGSTWFCQHLSQMYNLQNLDEYFGDHDITVSTQIDKLDYIKSNRNVVLKCFPWHLNNSRTNFNRANFLEKSLLKLADSTYILIRKDFNSQCKSYYLAKQSDVWSGQPQQHQTITVDHKLYQYCADHLIDGYQQLALLNQRINCTVVEYESLPFPADQRYVRPITWTEQPPTVDFDVTALFYPN